MVSSLQLVLANLGRRPLRNGVTAVGVAVAIAMVYCMAAFQRGYQNGLKDELDRLGAHLLVVPKGCPYDAASIALHGASWPCYLKGDYLKTVQETPHVAVAAPVFMSAVYDSVTGAQCVYCGVEPSIAALKRTWRIEGRFPCARGEVLVGSELARSRHLRVGEEMGLTGLQGVTGRIAGVLAPTQSADDLFVFLPLADAQRIFRRPGSITHILVRLTNPDLVDEVTSALRGCDAGLDMNVVPLAHLFHTIENIVQSTRLLLLSVALIGLLVAAAGVSNAVLMAVVERTREIGVLRAIGACQSDIFRMIWWETLTLSALGGAAGLGLAVAASRGVEAWLRARLPFAPHSPLVRAEWPVIAACMVGALVVGTLAAALPSWRATRLSPTAAMRAAGAL